MNSAASIPSFFQLWLKTSFRHWARHKVQLTILVAILALGVASFLSIRMANRAAIKGFRGFTESITGSSDITLNAQGDRFLTEWLPEIRSTLNEYSIEIAPVLEIPARIQCAELKANDLGFPITIVGIDVVGIANIQNTGNGGRLLNTESINQGFNLFEVMGEPRSIFISPGLADQLSMNAGESLSVLINDRVSNLDIRGILPANRLGVEMPPSLTVMDLPAAMDLVGDNEAVTRVELILESDTADRLTQIQSIEATLSKIAAGRWNVTSPQGEQESNAMMTSAFRLNLAILSLISLLVGIYLITQSMDAAVIQRRKEMGILRALGVLPSQIRKLWLIDLLLFGFLGSLLGILLGWLAAQSVVVAIARTVNALYLNSTAKSAQLNMGDCVYGLLLGFVGSLIAGLFPLTVANQIQPAKVLASGRQEISRSRFPFQRLGWGLLLLGLVFSQLPAIEFTANNPLPVFGYITAFTWLIGGSLVLAGLMAPVGQVLRRTFAFSIGGNLGFGKLRTPGNRHRLAVSGLFIAVGMAASMTILIGSFEATVLGWMNNRFQADLYASNKAFTGGSSDQYVSEETVDELASLEDIAEVSPSRYLNIRYEDRPVFLVGFKSSLMGSHDSFLWINEPLPLERIPPEADSWVITNEAFQYRFGHDVGDLISIPTPLGDKRLWIRGVKADYGSDRGSVLIDEAELRAWYGARDYSNLSLYLKPDRDPKDVAIQLRERFPHLAIREQESLLKNAIRIFNETFAVTYALRILGLFVAVVGLALALMNILKEDAASLATLNGLGVLRKERAYITACEGLGMTLIACVGGILLSLGLGWLLVYVINRQSFGWTLQYTIPWSSILGLGALLLILGFIVSWLVGWFNGNTKPLQEE